MEPTWKVCLDVTPNVHDGMGRKPVGCFRCRQLGHYASDCPNPRFVEEYAPLCANCKQSGHFHYQCNVPFNPNNRDQQMPSTVQIIEETNKPQESTVHRVEAVQRVLTRNQQKAKGPIQILEKEVPAPVNRPIPISGKGPLLVKGTPTHPISTSIIGRPPNSEVPILSQFGD